MATAVIESNESSFPPEQKFFIEAAKRRRADGTAQFQLLHFSNDQKLRELTEDPFADHGALDKLPVPIEAGGQVKFVILGAGIGGIVQAIRLIQKGFTADQILLVDWAGGVGGTWYWNRYPGLHCDVESYVYMPLLEETGYIPTQKYASHVEIRRYLEHLIEKFGLQNRILYRSTAKSLKWDEKTNKWTTEVTARRGPQGKEKSDISFGAEFVIVASGLFLYPQVPKVRGLTDFQMPVVHSSRWNYDITGGSADTAFPEMDKLKGKRVGIIGTGATAIQVMPQVAKYAKDLYIFQRTPSQVFTRGQRDTDPAEWKEKIAANPGWHKARRENHAENVSANIPEGNNLVNDEWSKLDTYSAILGSNKFGIITPEKAQEHIGTMMAMDARHTQKARGRVQELIKDKETAEKLTPWYPTWCKRPCFSDLYLEAFNEPSVHLVDTDGKGIDYLTSNSVVANGKDYPVDVLIFCTGYRSPSQIGDPGSKTNVDVVGRKGRSMADKWNEEGYSSFHGILSNGFPNLFFHSPIQSSATTSKRQTARNSRRQKLTGSRS